MISPVHVVSHFLASLNLSSITSAYTLLALIPLTQIRQRRRWSRWQEPYEPQRREVNVVLQHARFLLVQRNTYSRILARTTSGILVSSHMLRASQYKKGHNA